MTEATIPSSVPDLLLQLQDCRANLRYLEYANFDVDSRIDAEDALQESLRNRVAALILENRQLTEELSWFRHRFMARIVGLLGLAKSLA